MNINSLNKITAKIIDPIEIVRENMRGNLTTIPGMLKTNTAIKIKRSSWLFEGYKEHTIHVFVDITLKNAARDDIDEMGSRLTGIILNRLNAAFNRRTVITYDDMYMIIFNWRSWDSTSETMRNSIRSYDRFTESSLDDMRRSLMAAGMALFKDKKICLTRLGRMVVQQLGIDKIMIPENIKTIGG